MEVLEESPWRVRVKVLSGRFWREVVWCLADIEVSSAKTKVCDGFKKKKRCQYISQN